MPTAALRRRGRQRDESRPVRRDAGVPRRGAVRVRGRTASFLGTGGARVRGVAARLARLRPVAPVPRLRRRARGGRGLATGGQRDGERATGGQRDGERAKGGQRDGREHGVDRTLGCGGSRRFARARRAARRDGIVVRCRDARLELHGRIRGGRRAATGGGAAVGALDVVTHGLARGE